METASYYRALERREPDAGKLACPVLRGRGGGNIALLPGSKTPALPKGVSAPPPTVFTVYIQRKQWGKVKEAIANSEDVLIIEGVAGYDPEMEGIVVSASAITTKLLQQAKKAAPAAATGSDT